MDILSDRGPDGQSKTTTQQHLDRAEQLAGELAQTNEGRFWAKRASGLRDQIEQQGGAR